MASILKGEQNSDKIKIMHFFNVILFSQANNFHVHN